MSIQDDIFFSEKFTEKEKHEILKYKNVIIEEIKWENITISDFIDFIDFSDYECFQIIANTDSQRLNNIITHVENETGVKIAIINIQKTHEDFYSLKKLINFSEDNNTNLLLANSYNALHTGFYPTYESVHIKHIFLENINMYQKINQLSISLFENLGFNSLIILKEATNLVDHTQNSYFSKIITFEDLREYNKEIYFENITVKKIESIISDFKKTGIINYRNAILSDIGRYLSNKQLSGIFINEEGIYFDFSQNLKLSQNIDIDVYELINYLNIQPIIENMDDESLKLFFIMHTIVEAHKENLLFISPFNRYEYEPINNDIVNKYTNWIGFESSTGSYLYNVNTNKTYEVTNETIIVFEKLIKNIDIDDIDQTLLDNLKENLSNENG